MHTQKKAFFLNLWCKNKNQKFVEILIYLDNKNSKKSNMPIVDNFLFCIFWQKSYIFLYESILQSYFFVYWFSSWKNIQKKIKFENTMAYLKNKWHNFSTCLSDNNTIFFCFFYFLYFFVLMSMFWILEKLVFYESSWVTCF